MEKEDGMFRICVRESHRIFLHHFLFPVQRCMAPLKGFCMWVRLLCLWKGVTHTHITWSKMHTALTHAGVTVLMTLWMTIPEIASKMIGRRTGRR